jgi:hypothetical protein
MIACKHSVVAAALCAGILLPATAQEQPAGPQHKPGSPPPWAAKAREGMREKIRERIAERLSPEERARFESARKQALEDPAIKSLRERAEATNREFFEAMRAKMIEIDPGLKDIIKDKGGKHGPRGKGPQLSEGEQQRLKAARDIAVQAPSVQAAAEKRDAATTKEERGQAGREYADTMREAMLQADPTIAPILEKVGPPRGQR